MSIMRINVAHKKMPRVEKKKIDLDFLDSMFNVYFRIRMFSVFSHNYVGHK